MTHVNEHQVPMTAEDRYAAGDSWLEAAVDLYDEGIGQNLGQAAAAAAISAAYFASAQAWTTCPRNTRRYDIAETRQVVQNARRDGADPVEAVHRALEAPLDVAERLVKTIDAADRRADGRDTNGC